MEKPTMSNEPHTPTERKIHRDFLNFKKVFDHLEDLISRDEDEEHAEWERLRSYVDYEPDLESLPFDAIADEDKPCPYNLCDGTGERWIMKDKHYGNIVTRVDERTACRCKGGQR
jgi:hypothetical protein